MELSKQVQRHKDLADKLLALVESRKEALPAALAKRFAARLAPGETMPDLGLFVRLLLREVSAHQESESIADQEATREAGDDPAVIKALEDAQQGLYSEMTLLRSEVETGYGAAGVSALGMKTTPTRAQDLEAYALAVLKSLQDPKISLGESRSKRMTFDREGAAKSLAPLVDALVIANKDYAREAAELKVAQERRAEAIETFKTETPALGATLRALFALAGDTKGAERIVLNPYRKGKTEEIEITDDPTDQ